MKIVETLAQLATLLLRDWGQCMCDTDKQLCANLVAAYQNDDDPEQYLVTDWQNRVSTLGNIFLSPTTNEDIDDADIKQ